MPHQCRSSAQTGWQCELGLTSYPSPPPQRKERTQLPYPGGHSYGGAGLVRGQQGRTFHVDLPEGRGMVVGHNGFTGSLLGWAGQWPGGLGAGKGVQQGGPVAGLGASGRAGAAASFIRSEGSGRGRRRAQRHGPLSGGSTLEDPGALSQHLAELLETPLHLRNACQLLLKPLLLLSQA